MDIIFCRNVLMYFRPDTMRRVVERSHDALRDGGYLFVAPSEASHEFFPQFERVASRGEIFYRKVGAGHAAGDGHRAGARPGERRPHSVAPAIAPRANAGVPVAPGAPGTARRTPAWRPAAEPAEQSQRPAAQSAATTTRPAPRSRPKSGAAQPAVEEREAAASGAAAPLAAAARRAANEGRLREALASCEEAIAADKLSAGYRYLYATISPSSTKRTMP